MLRVIYRSHGGENKKGRPAFYSKRLALVSFLRAISALDQPCQVIYLNDGPMPEDRLAMMGRSGEVIARENMRLAGSLSVALDLPKERGWAADDLVWLAEDDYLYLPDAFSGLLEAAREFPQAEYFALYATVGERGPHGGDMPDFFIKPDSWHDSEPVLVRGQPWRRGLSTTSTFGARAGALRADRLVMELAIRAGGAFDQTTCLMIQGFLPFKWRTIFNPHGVTHPRVGQRARAGAFRGGLNLWQVARNLFGGPARLLIAPEPALSTHMEAAYMAAGTDWAEVARDCLEWGIAEGWLEQPEAAALSSADHEVLEAAGDSD